MMKGIKASTTARPVVINNDYPGNTHNTVNNEQVFSFFPIGWDQAEGFNGAFPDYPGKLLTIRALPRGSRKDECNRLIQGDNLWLMRRLPDESVDVIYLDPPFFTQKIQQSDGAGTGTVLSYSDVWQDGLPGYLAWLNARLFEARRILKSTGSLYLHCDWHASHYIKVEADKIFGYDNMRNEIVWYYNSGARSKKDFGRRHDVILRYSKSAEYYMDLDAPQVREPYSPDISIPACKAHYYDPRGKVCDDVWRIPIIAQNDRKERLGYPTQKPEKLLERILSASCPPGGVVADFFCGSGTTPAVATKLGMRWIACDESAPAIEITRDRLSGLIATGTDAPAFSVECIKPMKSLLNVS